MIRNVIAIPLGLLGCAFLLPALGCLMAYSWVREKHMAVDWKSWEH